MNKLQASSLFVLTIALSFAGCSAPRLAPDNLRLTSSLRTAISTRQSEWLEQNVSAIEARKSAGEMSDAEYDAFQSIIAKAKAGQWEAAEKAIVRLQKAQRPTKEQVGRLPKIDA
jgi:hypothetical protein